MENSQVRVERKLRPTRLTFVLKAGDFQALRRAVEISTLTWGGKYNTIVPAYKRLPMGLRECNPRPSSAGEWANGFVSNCSPDYLVSVNEAEVSKLAFPKYRVKKCSEVLRRSTDPISCSFGVTEIYSHLYHEQYKFSMRTPVPTFLPDPDQGDGQYFVNTWFGMFPQEPELERFRSTFERAFGPETHKVDSGNLFSMFEMNSALQLGSSLLNRSWGTLSYPNHIPLLVYFDMNSWDDLVDLWNLRAFGFNVVPVPAQWSQDLLADCRRLILASSADPDGPILQRSNAIAAGDFDEFVDAVSVGLSKPPLRRSWFPPLWLQYPKEMSVPRTRVWADSESSNFDVREGKVTFGFLSPPLGRIHYSATWVNEVRIDPFGFSLERANVIPAGLQKVDEVFNLIGGGLECWSGEDSVTVALSRYVSDFPMAWELPTPHAVFNAWFAERGGYQIELSSAGKLARQITRQFGNIWNMYVLTFPEVLRLLGEMADPKQKPWVHRSKWVSELKAGINRRAQTNGIKLTQAETSQRASAILNLLAKHKVIKVGLEIKCPTCSRGSWYGLQRVSEKLECDHCLGEFSFPTADPPADAWHYRTAGPFAIRGSADGGYPVVLAMRFLTHFTEIRALTLVPSFEVTLNDAKSESTLLEVDFGAFLKSDINSDIETLTMFGECKSHNSFDERDIRKLAGIGKRFPGAVLAFCTLKPNLSNSEVRSLTKLATAGRRISAKHQWLTPILVLTAAELLSTERPPRCWKTGSGGYQLNSGIYGLCDATQQIHLGMKPFGRSTNFGWRFQ